MVTCLPILSLFGSAELLRSSWALLPKVTRDGDGINTHGHGFGRDDRELLAVRAVLVNGLHHLRCDDARADAGEPYHLICFGVHGVNCSELAAGISEEDEKVIGRALLHFLDRQRKLNRANSNTLGTNSLRDPDVTQFLTSTILFFCGSLTLPAKQQRVIALWMMNLLDLKLGSLYNFGPARHHVPMSDKTKHCLVDEAF